MAGKSTIPRGPRVEITGNRFSAESSVEKIKTYKQLLGFFVVLIDPLLVVLAGVATTQQQLAIAGSCLAVVASSFLAVAILALVEDRSRVHRRQRSHSPEPTRPADAT